MTCTLKQKMLIPLLASVIISGLIGLPFVQRELANLKNRFVRSTVLEKKGEIERAVDKAGQEALQKAALFSEIPQVIEAFRMAHSGNINDETDAQAQKARELLRRELSPMLAGYSAVSGGDKLKLHFHLPNGRSLVRLWREKQTRRNNVWVDVSDDISSFRNTVLDVNRSGEPVRGIELGRGGFVVRGLAPVKTAGRQLGSVEVLVDFEPIFRRAVAEHGQNLLLYMNADKLDITRRLQDPAKYPKLADRYVLVSGSSDGSVEKRIDPAMLDAGRQDTTIRAVDDMALAAFPVKDYQGKQIGVMVFAFDTTAIAASISRVFLILGVIGTIVLVLVVLVNYTALLIAVIRPVNKIARDLKTNAFQVSSSSNQISSSSQTLAEGASEAAASIEETSASLEEISSVTRQNADHAMEADNLMGDAARLVNSVNESMARLTSSMDDISAGSEETFKIIKTIDDIAFQTNLLALNAAVEAARAGEAGSGFAVVADEVRNLAMRAAEAARNTAELIENTVKQVKDGAGLVGQTNDAFAEVLDSSRKVGQLVSEIATASKEQANGIEQINRAINEMDKVTQRNAANAEESAAASEELNAMAEQMHALAEQLAALICGQLEETVDIEEGSAAEKTSHRLLPFFKNE